MHDISLDIKKRVSNLDVVYLGFMTNEIDEVPQTRSNGYIRGIGIVKYIIPTNVYDIVFPNVDEELGLITHIGFYDDLFGGEFLGSFPISPTIIKPEIDVVYTGVGGYKYVEQEGHSRLLSGQLKF